ncbi:hypothetical protein DL93DRAFT_1305357 [Clavulina sp. PMI_390]|nr:hypothetical protein DL93DRAFT_1305357 [Clavulina sp. PMI_390]
MPNKELVPSEFYHPDPYPRLWDWEDLKQVVDSGDLAKLLRYPAFQDEYDANNDVLRQKHGSVVNFLVKIRLNWDLNEPIDPAVKPYFTTDIPDDLVRVVFNDWPYSVPEGVSHYVVWSRLPLTHVDLVPAVVWDRVGFDGLWDFTGSHTSVKYDGPLAGDLKVAGRELDTFVKNMFPEGEWECAWFMNPTRLQSVPGLAHYHVFARKKSPGETESTIPTE